MLSKQLGLCRRFVWAQLGDHIMELSRNKCASNVIEKCLATGGQGEVKKWVDSLCAKHDKLAELMKDQYGNYVCFTAFLVGSMLFQHPTPLHSSISASITLH